MDTTKTHTHGAEDAAWFGNIRRMTASHNEENTAAPSDVVCTACDGCGYSSYGCSKCLHCDGQGTRPESKKDGAEERDTTPSTCKEILEAKRATAEKADPSYAPFGLEHDEAKLWHRAQASAYQHALEMLPLHVSNDDLSVTGGQGSDTRAPEKTTCPMCQAETATVENWEAIEGGSLNTYWRVFCSCGYTDTNDIFS